VNLKLWLAARFLSHGAQPGSGEGLKPASWWRRNGLRPGLPATLSILGLAIGVASLTVAMAVVSGFETTLKGALIDVFGHLLVVKRGEDQISFEKASEKLRENLPDFVAVTPFITLEAIVVGKQKLNGVVIQGVDAATVDTVLNLKSRVIRGEFKVGHDGKDQDGLAKALVGKALAKRFGLEIGQTFKAVLPRPSLRDTAAFVSKIATFQVSGIIDFGKADYDERTVITSLTEARQLGNLSVQFTGLRVKLRDANRASAAAAELTGKLGPSWWIMDWSEGNRNFFRAIKYERIAIFFVILIMVIAASFNVASNIFIGVLRRTAEISILRALGFSKRDVASLFQLQGLLFGVVGVISGLLLGGILAGLFVWAQDVFQLLPAEVYKLNKIGVEFDVVDISVVVVTAIAICVVASLSPAARASNLDPVEGLRHE
jgi:lipoprotein-releasing system permease protein